LIHACGDFRGINFRDVDLTGAQMINIDLSDADLSGAKLVAADLTQANLTRAKLVRTELDNTKFRRQKKNNELSLHKMMPPQRTGKQRCTKIR
jgi:uncharacterized protein YjbI with pentapeptide repeats